MYPSRIIEYQDPLSWTFLKFLLTPICELLIFFKLLMYVLDHGCLLSLYKFFFNLRTWVCLSCASTPTGCKCIFTVYAFFSWESLCYESCLVSHDVSIYCMMELRTSLQVSILHPKHHSSWTGLPYILGYFFIAGRFCINDVTAFVILFFILGLFLESSSLVLRNKSRPSFLVGDYVCDLSYK